MMIAIEYDARLREEEIGSWPMSRSSWLTPPS